jgi:hypothetical protein
MISWKSILRATLCAISTGALLFIAASPEFPDDLSGEQMKISIGPGTLNTLPMGQMGSGSSRQPGTTRRRR